MTPETLVALPAAITPVTGIRSTLIQSSLNVLRRRELFDRYAAVLDPVHRDALLESMAPEWLPLEVAAAHYRACDALGLAEGQVIEIGAEVGTRIQGTFLGTLIRNGRAIGLTPWVLLAQFARLWARVIQGGAVAVSKVGPKDCQVEFRSLPLCEIEYFRNAYRGVVAAGITLGAGKAVAVRVANAGSFGFRCILRCSWV